MIRQLFPHEDKVYETLLITSSNLTPVGVRRKNNCLFFRIFEGKSYRDLLRNTEAIIQIIPDAEFLVSIAFNIFPRIEFSPSKEVRIRRIKGYPWIEGYVECKKIVVVDSLGKSKALDCVFEPVYVGTVKAIPTPISRADNALLELGVLASRLLVGYSKGSSETEKLKLKVRELYRLYKKLGGRSDIAEEIYMLAMRGSDGE
ncbi:DUF447 domain-containing protein [Pyrococcus kukulkanii]|uniref:ABC transporter ATPase n=1 Tax=Pyrococcus kukulkanii TaxID=1609559 RepID=A0A127BC95_9EURY|nr:DUF447 domain-containing protein [Pyrococcus kukulkanii]AMM54825.1 ABC transporter ATPase [Pyrococcus kukulkanii]